MDIHQHSAFERLEIVEVGRHRRWSDGEKLRIVVELPKGGRLRISASMPPALAAAVLKTLR